MCHFKNTQISFSIAFAAALVMMITASNMEEGGGKTIQIVASSPVSKVTIKRGVDYEDVIIEKSPSKKKKKKNKAARRGKAMSPRGRPRSYWDDDDDHQDELQQRVLYDRMLMDQLVEQLLLDAKRGRKRKGRRRGGKKKNANGRRREKGRKEENQAAEFEQDSPIKELRHRRWTQVMEHLLEANWQ